MQSIRWKIFWGWLIRMKMTTKERAVLFGCGEFGKEAYRNLVKKYNIVGCIDSDKKKWGKDFYDVKISSLSFYNDFDGIFIVTADIPFSIEISKILVDEGINKDRIYLFSKIFPEYTSEIIPLDEKNIIKVTDDAKKRDTSKKKMFCYSVCSIRHILFNL